MQQQEGGQVIGGDTQRAASIGHLIFLHFLDDQHSLWNLQLFSSAKAMLPACLLALGNTEMFCSFVVKDTHVHYTPQKSHTDGSITEFLSCYHEKGPKRL
jgi:hypothetical protein